jgi:hypothetical protein
MTDLLLERFAELADDTDDSDWDEVRRRARRRYAVPVLAVAAATVTAAAVAGTSGWLFTSHDRQVTAVTYVAFHGGRWRIALSTRAGHWLSRPCVRFTRPGGATIAAGCSGATNLGLGLPFSAEHVVVDGGQIWAGATPAFVRRIAITDDAGDVHSTPTAAAPRGTRTPFRYWVVALDGNARVITAYGAGGRAFRRTLP